MKQTEPLQTKKDREETMGKTIGLAELTSITYGIAASDAMLKAGQVKLLRSAPACPGKYLILIAGDTGEVKAAMEAERRLQESICAIPM